MTEKNLLEVIDLKVEFNTDEGRVLPVDGVSFSLNDGETTAIVGESGCGKSLTALSIMGLIDKPGRIVGGKILFEGKDLLCLSKRERHAMRGKELAMIFQEPMSSLNPVFTVGYQIAESILLHQNVDQKEAKKRSIELLKRTGIPRAEKVFDSYPHSLSGGMCQRAMIAIALSCNPKLLIADEPTTALDVSIQSQILDILHSLAKEDKKSILLITHDFGVVAEMADQVVIMYAGQVVEKSDVFSLFDEPKHPYT
ncbi:MAG: ABC transporter ATP-binding protein, partial [Dethiobacteria bacterium]